MIPPDELAMLERVAGGASCRHARLVRDDPAQDRGDLRQAALLELLRERRGRGPLPPGLAKTVANHAAIAVARSMGRECRDRARTEALGRLDLAAVEGSPDLPIDLADALASMPPTWAAVVSRKLAGWTDREIAVADGTTLAGVAGVYYRAKAGLRAALAAYARRSNL